MKILILATGETKEIDESYALRLMGQGLAAPAPKAEKKAVKAEVEVTDKLPETEAEAKPAKGKKTK